MLTKISGRLEKFIDEVECELELNNQKFNNETRRVVSELVIGAKSFVKTCEAIEQLLKGSLKEDEFEQALRDVIEDGFDNRVEARRERILEKGVTIEHNDKPEAAQELCC